MKNEGAIKEKAKRRVLVVAVKKCRKKITTSKLEIPKELPSVEEELAFVLL